MVRVMEEQQNTGADRSPLAEIRDKLGIIPFMHHDDVDAIADTIEIKGLRIIDLQIHARHQVLDFRQDARPAIAQRVAATPGVFRLINRNLMTKADELARNAAQEMGVAIIPARYKGLIEKSELHGQASPNWCRAARRLGIGRRI